VYSMLKDVQKTHFNKLHYTATHCNTHCNKHCNTHRRIVFCYIEQTACIPCLMTSQNTQQQTASHCNTLQHTATHIAELYSVMLSRLRVFHVKRHPKNTLQHTATHCNTLQHTATHIAGLYSAMLSRLCVFHVKRHPKNTLQHTATHCNTHRRIAFCDVELTVCILCPKTSKKYTATHCNILQHTATHIAELYSAILSFLYVFYVKRHPKIQVARHIVPYDSFYVVCCSVLQCFAVFCSVLHPKNPSRSSHCTICKILCSVLQCVAVCCSVL